MTSSPTKTYGSVRFAPPIGRWTRGAWLIDCKPHVAEKLKRWFRQLDANEDGTLILTATREASKELLWIFDLFPMTVSHEDLAHMKALRAEYDEAQAIVQRILSGERLAGSGWLQPAVTPYDFQLQAADMAMALGRLLIMDETGLGKTFSSYLTLRDPDNLPALVVCDSHMQLQWQRQLAKFFPMLRSHIVRKRAVYDPSQMRDMRGYRPDVLITNYAKIDAWAQHLRGNVQTIILDEIQALRTGGGTGKYNGCAMIAAAAKLIVGASASPIYNYGGEAHHILQVIERDCLGTREEFIRAWGKKMNGGKIGVRDPRALGTHLRDKGLVIRRTRKDVKKELPAVIRIPHEVDADERTFDEELASVGAFAVADLILSGDGAHKEVFKARGDIDWQMRRATGLAKAAYVAAFAELILESERKIILAGWHRDVYSCWLEQLRHFHPVLYTGSESAAGKDRNARRFIEDKQTRVLIMSLRSGQGIDGLQEACHVVLFGELDWSPQMHKQLVDRLNRDGMDHSEPVVAYFLTCDFGSDPFVMETLGIKRGQAEPIVDPETSLFSQVTPDARDRVRLLAEAAIARRRSRRAVA